MTGSRDMSASEQELVAGLRLPPWRDIGARRRCEYHESFLCGSVD